MDTGRENTSDQNGTVATSGPGLAGAGRIVSITRTVPLSSLTTPSGNLSLAKLRRLVYELKAGYAELSDLELGDLEFRRHGLDVELRAYFLPETRENTQDTRNGPV